MKLLLDRGANANARDKKFGQTALMWAAGSRPRCDCWSSGGRYFGKNHDLGREGTIYTPVVSTLGKPVSRGIRTATTPAKKAA